MIVKNSLLGLDKCIYQNDEYSYDDFIMGIMESDAVIKRG